MSDRYPLSAALLSIALVAAARPAVAFECLTVRDSSPRVTYVWQSRCLPYSVSRVGTLFDSPAARSVVARSFRRWSDQTCTDLTFKDEGDTDGYDSFDLRRPAEQRNTIASVEDPNEVARFEDPDLLAQTLHKYVTRTGEILDADILFNAVRFRFGQLTDPAACSAAPFLDLENTLVHEIGHLIGLEHVALREATMFPEADDCETKKRDLAADDLDGLCMMYPRGAAAWTCAPPAEGYIRDGGFDPTPFRNPCERAEAGPDAGLADVDAGVEPLEEGGCQCGSTPERRGPPLAAWILGAVLLHGVRRRTFSARGRARSRRSSCS